MSVSKEAIEAFALAFWPVNAVSKMESCSGDIAKALKAALPFLSPIAGEGKAELYTKLIAFLGKVQGVSMGVAMSGKDHPNPDGALMDLFNEAQELYLEHLDSPSSPGKDGGQEVEAVSDEAIAAIWRAAMTAATNIIIKRQNDLNDDDGPMQVLDEQGACINALKTWMEVDEVYLYELRLMVNGATEPASPQPASTALVERLTKALEPFSRIAEIFDYPGGNRPTNDSDPISGWSDHRVNNGEDILMTVGDLRRARSALSASQCTSREGER